MDCKHEVLTLFEARSREQIPAASDKDSMTVRDELAKFVDDLVQALREQHTETTYSQNRMAILHGQQRAGIMDYTLIQVLKEYRLLREIVVDVLLREGSLSERERKIIHRTIDSAIELAGNEFATAEQAKLKLALSEAEQSNHDLDQIAGVLAHDLRSPLGTISGFTELLEEEVAGKLSAEAEESLKYIRSAVGRRTHYIDGVLSYARLKAEKPDFSTVNFNEVVLAAVQNLKSQMTEKGGRALYEKLPIVRGNFALLSHVIQNFIANSLKFSRTNAPPIIWVRAQAEGNMWVFSVEDNGKGFDPGKKEFIFGLYNKIADQENPHGAGIGLATCRRVIEIHGGRLWAEGQLGKGATFFFTLPRINSV